MELHFTVNTRTGDSLRVFTVSILNVEETMIRTPQWSEKFAVASYFSWLLVNLMQSPAAIAFIESATFSD
jgi:hypothetical protein